MGHNTLRFTVAIPQLVGIPATYCAPSGPGIIGLNGVNPRPVSGQAGNNSHKPKQQKKIVN